MEKWNPSRLLSLLAKKLLGNFWKKKIVPDKLLNRFVSLYIYIYINGMLLSPISQNASDDPGILWNAGFVIKVMSYWKCMIYMGEGWGVTFLKEFEFEVPLVLYWAQISYSLIRSPFLYKTYLNVTEINPARNAIFKISTVFDLWMIFYFASTTWLIVFC